MLQRRWTFYLLRVFGVVVTFFLFAFMTLPCILCGTWWSDHSSHNHAKTQITKLGGSSLGVKNCGPPIPSDAGLLTHIHLSGTMTGDDDIRFLSDLRRANLIGTLTLGNTQVSDAGMGHLMNLSGLGTLDLSGTQIGDAGLLVLQEMPYLHELNLNRTKVTDEGLTILGKMNSLNSLRLAGTGITDAGVAHLKGLTGLGFLYLDHTQITDGGLLHLKGNRISFISLKETRTGPAEALKNLLPGTTIHR